MSSQTLPGVRCPVCKQIVLVKYTMRSPQGDQLVYNMCPCGTIFHNEPIDKKKFTADHLAPQRDNKFFGERLNYMRRTYMPIIEDQIYGRESLDIGFGFPENIIDMRERGWVASGIDIAKNDFITGDFESYDFKGKKFDLVIMSHVLQSFADPIKALKKAVDLIKYGGLLFIAAPDTSMVLLTSYAEFGHWSAANRVMLSRQRIVNECIRAGMNEEPLVNIQNTAKRYLIFNDCHLLLKKGLRDE